MPTATAPPPAAPAAPPAPVKSAPAPVAPPPSRPTAPPEEAPREEWTDDLVSKEIESLDENATKQQPKTEPKAKIDKPQEQVTPPEEKETEDVSPGKDQGDIETSRPTKVVELRKAFEQLQKRVKEDYKPKLQKAEARIKELESSKPEESPEVAERYKSIEKRSKELEAHIKFLDYSKSEEYQTKYEQPYVEAFQDALNDFAQLKVDMGEAGTRKGTEKDLLELANMEIGDAIDKAEEKFGKSGAFAINHVREIQKLFRAKQKALADAQSNASKIAEQNQREGGERQRRNNQLWQEANKQLITKYPERFGPVEGDTPGNEALAKGKAFAKLVYQDSPLTEAEIGLLPASIQQDLKTNNGRLSPEATIRVNAVIANKASNHDRLLMQVNALRKELAEVNKSLEEFKQSEPPGGGTAPNKKEGVGHWNDEADAELDELSRKSGV